MQYSKKQLLPFLVLLMSLSFWLSCRQPLDKAEAGKHLRAMDHEMLSLMNQIQGNGSFKVLKEILAIENVPTPFFAHKSPEPGAIRRFDFDKHKGFYEYDSVNQAFMRTAGSDSIIIIYHMAERPGIPARIIISAYDEEAGSSSLMFPLKLEAALYVGDRQTARISHIARLEHQLPVEARLQIELENYRMEMDFRNRLRRDYGKVRIAIVVERDQKELMRWVTRSKAGLTNEGSFFMRWLKVDFQMFPVKILAKVENDAIDPHTIDFVEEFNKHSRIRAVRKADGRQIGDIRLRTRENSDKINYAFHFSDGSYLFVEDMMLTAREILNIKK